MKKTVTILGYVFLALIVLVTFAFGALYLYGKKLDKESKAYADAAVLAIATDWNVAELKKRASREFDEAVDYEELADYFEELSQLGELVEYQGSSGESTITLSLRYGHEITADYAGTVEFEDGSAEMRLVLIKLDGQWQVLDFRVTPQTFTDDKNIV